MDSISYAIQLDGFFTGVDGMAHYSPAYTESEVSSNEDLVLNDDSEGDERCVSSTSLGRSCQKQLAIWSYVYSTGYVCVYLKAAHGPTSAG